MMTFLSLRTANQARLPNFKNTKGDLNDCADWTFGDWMTATVGELGEAANILKKVKRKDFSLEDAVAPLGKELADVIIYLDILADKAGIDLGEAVRVKWNEVSEKIGFDCRINERGILVDARGNRYYGHGGS